MEHRLFDATTETLDGPKIIEASAGTGKTFSITSMFLRLLLERDFSVGQILVVTFTEAATAELRKKIRARLTHAMATIRQSTNVQKDPVFAACIKKVGNQKIIQKRLRNAISSFDEAAIFTIHGFCHRMLHDSAFEGGFPFESELITETVSVIEDIVRDFLTQELADGNSDFIHFATAQKNLPQDLLHLAEKVIRHHQIQVQPDEPKPDVIDDKAFRDALEKATNSWKKEREEILALLKNAIERKDLSRVSYKTHKLDEWAQDLDDFFHFSPSLSHLPTNSMLNFSSTKLQSAKNKNGTCPEHPFFSECAALVSAAEQLEHDLEVQLLALKHRFLHNVRTQLPLHRERQNVLFYEDLLGDMDRALQGPGGNKLIDALRKRFSAALIDEFQDTSQIQYRIFKTIFHKNSDHLYLIGDPKQAIYAFRNADIYTYLEAVRDASTKTVTLDKNWRSDESLVKAVNFLFSRCAHPFLFPEIIFSPVQAEHKRPRFFPGTLDPAPIQFLYVPAPQGPSRGGKRKLIAKGTAFAMLPSLVAEHIKNSLNGQAQTQSGPVQPGDIAILVRKNEQARAIQAALRASHIPSVIYSQENVLASSEAEELIRIMAAAVDPGHSGLLRAAITTQALGVDALRLEYLAAHDDEWASIIDRFRTYQSLWNERGFIAMMRQMDLWEGVSERLVGYSDGERRITNWNHLIELLHAESRRNRFGPHELQAWFQKRRSQPAVLDELRLESDAAAVQVVTLHRCKGLEYPIVYCPYLWEQEPLSNREKELVFHDPHHQDRLTMDLGSPRNEEAVSQVRFERDAEGMRLLYVALTRAKHRVHVVWGGFNMMQDAPLSSLLHPSPESAKNAPQNGARTCGFEDEFIRQDLQHLADARRDLFHIELLEDTRVSDAPESHDSLFDSTLEILPLRKKVSAWRRVGSYSSLISRGSHNDRDHDQDSRFHEPDTSSDRVGSLQSPSLLADFPKGARAGECFHKIFEKMDFTKPTQQRCQNIIAAELTAYGFDAEEWTSQITEAISQLVTTPLHTQHSILHLKNIDQDNRLNELEFVFPIHASQDDSGSHGPLTGAVLSNILKRHGQKKWIRSYAKRIPQLQVIPLTGFLKGFIDLVFCQDDRWFLVDYKSNFLGPQLNDYQEKHLIEAIKIHHYVLQYHIYTLALHRYLQKRMDNYEYDLHFGGVLYLFIRGMSPKNDGQTGVFFDRPPLALIEAFSNACAERQGAT